MNKNCIKTKLVTQDHKVIDLIIFISKSTADRLSVSGNDRKTIVLYYFPEILLDPLQNQFLRITYQ